MGKYAALRAKVTARAGLTVGRAIPYLEYGYEIEHASARDLRPVAVLGSRIWLGLRRARELQQPGAPSCAHSPSCRRYTFGTSGDVAQAAFQRQKRAITEIVKGSTRKCYVG